MFDNRTITAPRDRKPHIVFRLGFWRVSKKQYPSNAQCIFRWDAAHQWVIKMNGGIRGHV